MDKFIKIYGERNTNTNYMSELIKLNLNVQELLGTVPHSIAKIQEFVPGNETIRDLYFYLTYAKNLGWKHTCVKPQSKLKKYELTKSDISFLTITKNPYSWLLSLYRKPYHQYSHSSDFESFLKTPWKTVSRDNTDKVLSSPIELWNIKNRSYLQLDSETSLNITSEAIFEDPAEIITLISKKLRISRKTEDFLNYDKSTKNESKDSNYYRSYYLNEEWRKKLSQEAIEVINESLDKELMSHFNYQTIT